MQAMGADANSMHPQPHGAYQHLVQHGRRVAGWVGGDSPVCLPSCPPSPPQAPPSHAAEGAIASGPHACPSHCARCTAAQLVTWRGGLPLAAASAGWLPAPRCTGQPASNIPPHATATYLT
jgi:hypothetical protein